MTKINVIQMTGKPQLSMGDLYEFALIRLDSIIDNKPLFDKIYVDSTIVLHQGVLKSPMYDGTFPVVSNTQWSDKYTTPEKRLDEAIDLVHSWSDRVVKDDLYAHVLLRRINKILDNMWKRTNVVSVEILLKNIKNGNFEVRVYNKKKSRVPDWKRTGLPKNVHTRAKKPTKMESKKMYASPVKKSNNLTKSCKKMTGNISGLGKNFNKLI